MHYEITDNDYLFSNNKQLLQQPVIHQYLSKESYWAQNIPLEFVEKTIEGSDCFGIYYNGTQVGFARVITDRCSFGYLADVFVLSDYRGLGLSKKLMHFIMSYPLYKNFRRFLLATRDAHGLYAKFGFKPLADPARMMEVKPFEIYPV